MKAYTARFITGLVVIAAGAALLFSNLEIYNFNELVKDWWPLAIIVAGLLIFLNDVKSYLWALLISGFGVFLQLKQLDIVDINPWQLFWPIAIIVIGVSIIFNHSASRRKVTKANRDDVTAVMAGSDKKNSSDDFQGSKLTAVMGGVKLDLRKAVIKKEATVEVFGFWGGIELVVPRDVVVRNQTSAVLGGVEDKTEFEGGKDAPILYVTGDVIMAGVEIKN
jgi:predicted membrane protein